MTAELLPPEQAVPSNPRWHELRRQGITASEIAACVGLSPWESAFSLYWAKTESLRVEETAPMEWGHRLEDAVAQKWAENHDAALVRAGLYASSLDPWMMATPDRLVYDPSRPIAPSAVLELKTASSADDGWGESGSDEIPVHYRCQVLVQMSVMNVAVGHVAVLIHGNDYREYDVIRDQQDIDILREAGRAMMRRLKDGDPPPLDAHPATLRTLRQLHPELDDREQEITWATAEGYRRSRAMLARAKATADLWEARLRAEMGDARKAVHDGAFIASRSIYDRAEHTVKASIVDRLNPARAKKGKAS